MAELTPLQPSADLRLSWQGALGEAGIYTFVPAVVGDSVYAAARNGAIARFDGGREAWRITAGQSLSGGVGADAALVVVGTPKGEVLAFDAATDSRCGRRASVPRCWRRLPSPTGLVVVRTGDAASSASTRGTASSAGCISAPRRRYRCAVQRRGCWWRTS